MKFRKLRIAWSVVCGVACLLMIVLWIGSYGENHRSFRVANIGWRSEQGVLMWYSPFALIDDGTHMNRYVRDDTFLESQPPVTLEWNVSFLGLNFFGPGSVWILEVPYWLTVLPTVVLAAAPWFPWSKGFSLRTLLIATTLVAVVLGLVVYTSRS
jgi:hypothetical protein